MWRKQRRRFKSPNIGPDGRSLTSTRRPLAALSLISSLLCSLCASRRALAALALSEHRSPAWLGSSMPTGAMATRHRLPQSGSQWTWEWNTCVFQYIHAYLPPYIQGSNTLKTECVTAKWIWLSPWNILDLVEPGRQTSILLVISFWATVYSLCTALVIPSSITFWGLDLFGLVSSVHDSSQKANTDDLKYTFI